MEYKYNISKDFDSIVELSKKQNGSAPIEKILESFNKISEEGRAAWETFDSDEYVKVKKEKIESFDDEKIQIHIVEPHNSNKEKLPCLIYYHGGAFIMPAFPYHIRLVKEYALKTPCKVICVDYRLAPKNPFPIGVKDCFSTLQWVYKSAENLEIDKDKIAVGGDSAGGALAAAITQMSRDKGGPKICFQMLCYPATDIKLDTDSMKKYTDTPNWDANYNIKMWQIYLSRGNKGIIQYAAPMEGISFKNLPDAYVEVAEFDPLRDEGINYAKALEAGGAKVELVDTKGTIHAYDMIAESEITKASERKRINALKKAFE